MTKLRCQNIIWITLLGVVLYILNFPCVFLKVTGYSCPFCGFTRMVDAVRVGAWQTAWNANQFLMVAIPAMLLMAVCECVSPRGTSRLREGTYNLLLIGGILFAVWRNFM